ncbi:MAG: hypothetical protein STSR0008_24830 [Ignavibacterium sp.]
MNKWYTYILYSLKIDKFYVGSTNDIHWRLERHNLGWGKFTKKGIPWQLMYYEEFEDKEHKLFGEDGFEVVVVKVEVIAKKLGIYDLSRFTPKL